MLNKEFRFVATTGRTASHFLDVLFSKHCSDVEVASFHDKLPSRLKAGNRHTAKRCLENYFINLLVRRPHAQTYIECNGALIEHVALQYDIKDGALVITDDVLATPAKSILLTRHPHGYVKSMLAKGWVWDWWKLSHFEQVHCKRSRWDSWGPLEKAAHAWRMKNRLFLSLTADENCITVKYENLFSKGQASFVRNIKRICNHFETPLLISDEVLAGLRQRKIEPKGGSRVRLTTAQKRKVDNICREMMEALGYV